MPDTRTVRLTVAYDGTDFHGFAESDGVRTVMGELRRAVETVVRCPVELVGAGRLDRSQDDRQVLGTASGEHRVDGHRHGGVERQAAEETFAKDAEVERARVFEVGAVLQIARVFRRLAIDEARLVGADHIVRYSGLGESG